ncbi:ferritin-like domain-containing protein [Candidatus Nephthysia bennettiae]|uniref:ferritin-like domain-containing protein n=1 Tax=Candidatus Nephthysia bennettiae TaxID=3127016 RepID=UPI0030C6DB8B
MIQYGENLVVLTIQDLRQWRFSLKQQLFEGKPVIEFETEQDRRGFLKYASLVGVGAALAACGNGGSTSSSTPAPAQSAATAPKFSDDDMGILNYALTLEYLEAEFYAKGTAGSLLGDDAKYITPIAQHEAAHVQALTQTIQKVGGTPAKKPTFKFPDGTFTDKAKFLATAQVFEETGVKAYQGQVTKIKDKTILGAAASIAGVESRHAAVIADILNKKQVPAPVEANAPMSEIIQAITPFLGA